MNLLSLRPLATTDLPATMAWRDADVLHPQDHWPELGNITQRSDYFVVTDGVEIVGITGLTELGVRPGVVRVVLMLSPMYRRTEWVTDVMGSILKKAFQRSGVSVAVAEVLGVQLNQNTKKPLPQRPWILSVQKAIDQVARELPQVLVAGGWKYEEDTMIIEWVKARI